MNTKEASMYEPRVGDLVSVEGTACVVIAKVTGGIGVRWANGRETLLGWGFAPLRPDAPGQRVRGPVGRVISAGVTREAMHAPLRDRSGFYVEWDSGGGGPWQADRLIRIADQVRAAPVTGLDGLPVRDEPNAAAPGAMCENCGAAAADGDTEDGVALCGACARAMDGAPVPVEPGPTCQHCGSGIVAGLLRDTCPRGCDLTLRAAEPEPDHVGTRLVPMRCGHEAVWIARGCGAIGTPHPTREGAIAAWREAVRR